MLILDDRKVCQMHCKRKKSSWVIGERAWASVKTNSDALDYLDKNFGKDDHHLCSKRGKNLL